MNPSFLLVLKSEMCIDISETDNSLFLSNVTRSQIWKWKRMKKGIPVHKIKSTHNTDEKERV